MWEKVLVEVYLGFWLKWNIVLFYSVIIERWRDYKEGRGIFFFRNSFFILRRVI